MPGSYSAAWLGAFFFGNVAATNSSAGRTPGYAFTITSGTGCETAGNCLFSHRRRGGGSNGWHGYGLNLGCVAEVHPDAGPIDVLEFSTEREKDILTINGVDYWGQENHILGAGPIPYGVVPSGTITWTADGDFDNLFGTGWIICSPMPSGTQEGSPFTVHPDDNGGCEADGYCLQSHRRRRYQAGDSCTVSVADGTGPIVGAYGDRIGLAHTKNSQLTINGYTYTKSMRLALGVRPSGIITWRAADTVDGWRFCVQPPQSFFDEPVSPTGAPGPSVAQPEEPVPSPVPGSVVDIVSPDVEAQNGIGGIRGTFLYPASASNKTIARLACESVYGTCIESSCRCFKYFSRSGAASCRCDKPPGEYEFVYEKLYACDAVSQDYSDDATVHSQLAGELSNSVQDTTLFVRLRTLADCSAQSWLLVIHTLGKRNEEARMLQQSLVLDLRAANYTPGSANWTSVVGPSAQVNDAPFSSDDRFFIFGSKDKSDIITVPGFPSLATLSWSVWAKLPPEVPEGLGIVMSNGPSHILDLRDLVLPSNEWFHIAVVFREGHESRTYVNGQLARVEAGSEGNSSQATDDILFLGGAYQFLYTNRTVIWVSDVAVFGYNLSGHDVRLIYAEGRPSGCGSFQPCSQPADFHIPELSCNYYVGCTSSCDSRPSPSSDSCNMSSWLQLDLGAVSKISQVSVQSCPGEAKCGAVLELSEDGAAWQTAFVQPQGTERASPMVFAQHAARHLRVSGDMSAFSIQALSTCKDDESWTDALHGDGYAICSDFTIWRHWCFNRGAYSLEAQQACPQSCGVCEAPYEALDTGCSVSSMLDETSDSIFTESALACYRRCLILEPCTHFVWEAGARCQRFKGCQGEAPQGEARAYSISRKTTVQPLPLLDTLIWRFSTNIQYSGSCYIDIKSGGLCKRSAKLLGVEWDHEHKVGDNEGISRCNLDSGVKMLYGSTVYDECTTAVPCICGVTTPYRAFAIYDYAKRTVGEENIIQVANAAIGVNAQISSFCVLGNSGLCRGRSRTLRMFGITHQLGPVSPFPVDWDGDGDTDLLLGRHSGSLIYLENIGGVLDISKAVGLPRTTSRGRCSQYWEAPNTNYGSCNHWCCYVGGHDICHGGGDWDKLFCQSSTAWGVNGSGPLYPVPFDEDGDSDLDLLVASCDGRSQLHFWRRDGSLFPDQSLFVNVTLGDSECVYPTIADWDADGDLDMLLGTSSGRIDYFENRNGHLHLLTGTSSPLYKINVRREARPLAVDWDADGDYDLLVGSDTGYVQLFIQTSQGSLVDAGPLPNVRTDGISIPRLVDFNGDGLIDVLLGGGSGGSMQVWLQDSEEMRLSEQYERTTPFDSLPVGRNAAPWVVDWDQNGFWDVIVPELDGKVTYLEAGNDGHLQPSSTGLGTLSPALGFAPVVQAVDWDKDGDMDLLIGQEGGQLLLYERDGALGPLRPGHGLMLEGNVTPLGTWPSPHAVDWDGDGDLDLIIGDSGDVPARRSMRLSGFLNEDWNLWYEEQPPTMSIGRREVYFSVSGNLAVAYCASEGYWFLFTISDANLAAAKNGECNALARTTGGALSDFQGIEGIWVLHGTSFPEGFVHPDYRTNPVQSDGSERIPHCNTCHGRDQPECGCNISNAMKQACAREMCARQGYTGYSLSLVTSNPVSQCTCIGTENLGDTDLFGATCRDYLPAWCGHYDTATFISTRHCCACGGGFLGDGLSIQDWKVTAECFDIDVWVNAPGAMIAELLPTYNETASVRYFERTSNGRLEERLGHENPFAAITLGYRPYPTVVDWNRDNLPDLILGSDSQPGTEIIESAGTVKRPTYAWSDGGTCQWSGDEQQVAANHLCRLNGFAEGDYLAGWGTNGQNTGLCDIGLHYSATGHAYVLDTKQMLYKSELSWDWLKRNMWIRARCRRGARTRYFERGESGQLVEKLDAENPFTDLTGSQTAIAQVLDWEGDGELDVVFSDGGNNLRYFKRGQMCTRPCNGMGLCNEVTGTCACLPGHHLGDCSSCLPDYFSLEVPTIEVAMCLPCPTDASGSVCAGRGTCSDDPSARLAVAWSSNSSSGFARGTGQCSCSPFFGGLDGRGLVSCADGRCPPGQELRFRDGPGACAPCAPGTGKALPGNDLCQVCPAGRFAESAGAAECKECPAGKFQARPGQEGCEPCLPGSDSTNGSAACSLCAVGSNASAAGTAQCLPCPPGEWSSEVGADRCTPCSTGRYGSGLAACQVCATGSFADVAGASACTLCSAGTYNPSSGSEASAVCQPCAIGKYSSAPGAQSATDCMPCETGATTKGQGSSNSSMCIQPANGRYTCVAGQECSLNLLGFGLEPSHFVAIATTGLSRTLVPNGISKPSSDGFFYQWSSPVLLDGGVYELLWCPNLHVGCTTLADFAFSIGPMEIIGPTASHFTCVRGKPCENLGPLLGIGLTSMDSLRVQRSCGGSAVQISQGEAAGFASIAAIAADTSMTFGFGPSPTSANPGDYPYQVCWCQSGQSCSSASDFLALAAHLSIEGPQTGQERSCYLGQGCTFAGIQGKSISPGDRLMVLDRCGSEGQVIGGIPGGGIAETTNVSSTFEFLSSASSASQVLLSVPGLYRLCFCRPTNSSPCHVAADFNADTGFFTARGPYDDHAYGCFAGDAECHVHDVRGVGLENGDELEVMPTDAPDGCDVVSKNAQPGHPAGLQVARVAAHDGGKNFSLGSLPISAAPGKYRLCWRPRSVAGAFGASMGYLFVTCPAGKFRLNTGDTTHCAECPQGFYCEGGSAAGEYVDDVRKRCSTGRTTLAKQSGRLEDCLCAPGYFLDGSGECTACSAGSYKQDISDSAACEACPNGTTSLSGCSSAELCFPIVAEERSAGNQSRAEIFVVEGLLYLPPCLSQEGLRTARFQLEQTLADLLLLSVEQVQLTFLEADPLCLLPGTRSSTRRLQSQPQPQAVTYRISQPTSADAERLRQNINLDVIRAALQSEGIILASITLPSIARELLSCDSVGTGMAFPLGGQSTSLDDCTCDAGYQKVDENSKACEPCQLAFFKDSPGPIPCSACPSATDFDDSTKQVRLITLALGATSEVSCTCRKGYYAQADAASPPSGCFRCGPGHYCEGGTSREKCPEGTFTQDNDVGQGVEACVCKAGYEPLPSDERNATHRCSRCPPGKFKVSVGDQLCTDDCRANSNSLPGASSSDHCFCTEGYYYESHTDSCQTCPPDGVFCAGGFAPSDSMAHAPPTSQAGYYLTAFAQAEPCFIESSEGGSVCLEGATAYNSSAACSGYQTGLMCGACLHLSVRDQGGEPCEPCEESFSDFMHIASINLDLLLKATFGIFLGKQAMDSATKTQKMEAVILRITLQWMTANSVLSTFDLSQVKLFDWSIDELKLEAGSSSITAVTTAQGISFRFQFPGWFQKVWRTMTALTGSLPSPMSPQVSLECLLQRQATPSDMPSSTLLLIPAIWWLLYPLLVTCWVALASLIIAKVVYPVAKRFTLRAKARLCRRLVAFGVNSETAKSALDSMDELSFAKLVQDPLVLKSDPALAAACGSAVFAEAAASFLLEKAGPQTTEMLEGVAANGATRLEVASAVRQALDGDAESMRSFLQRVFLRMEREKVRNVFTEPVSIPDIVRADLQSEQPTSMRLSARTSATSGGPVNMADEEVFGQEAVPGKDLNENYTIFGLFRDTSVANVLKDAFPLYLVTMYSIWDIVTRRMLSLVQVKTILLATSRSETGQEEQAVQSRWVYDMRYRFGLGDHTAVAVIGCVGLAIWSVAFLILLFRKLVSSKYMLQERHLMRNYGYFYNGLEPNVYWWEILVKKGDVLLIYVVTFTEIFHDPRAKLIMYLGLAGIFWALHNMYHPYDDRQNRLADRIEDGGLATRFITVLSLQILLMVNASATINAVVASLLVIINIRFLATIFFVLIIEAPNVTYVSGNKSGSAKVQASQRAVEALGMGGSNPISAAFFKIMNWMLAHIISPVVGLFLRAFAIAAKFKDVHAGKVPHLIWQGVGTGLAVVTHEEESLPWYQRIFAHYIDHLYKLSEHEQKSYTSRTIAQFWDYVLNNADVHQLPASTMDIFFILPSCLKEERAAASPDKSKEFHLRVATRVRDSLQQKVNTRDTARATKKSIALRGTFARAAGTSALPKFANCGEDFNSAVLFIQKLSKSEVHDFIVAVLEEVDNEAPLDARATNVGGGEEGNNVGPRKKMSI